MLAGGIVNRIPNHCLNWYDGSMQAIKRTMRNHYVSEVALVEFVATQWHAKIDTYLWIQSK